MVDVGRVRIFRGDATEEVAARGAVLAVRLLRLFRPAAATRKL